MVRQRLQEVEQHRRSRWSSSPGTREEGQTTPIPPAGSRRSRGSVTVSSSDSSDSSVEHFTPDQPTPSPAAQRGRNNSRIRNLTPTPVQPTRQQVRDGRTEIGIGQEASNGDQVRSGPQQRAGVKHENGLEWWERVRATARSTVTPIAPRPLDTPTPISSALAHQALYPSLPRRPETHRLPPLENMTPIKGTEHLDLPPVRDMEQVPLPRTPERDEPDVPHPPPANFSFP